MRGGPAVLAALALSACTTGPVVDVPPDPRIRTLVTEPVGEFLADARVASFLAQGCDDVVMTQELFNVLVITRETGGAAGARFDPRTASREAAVATARRFADLRARYGRAALRRSTCPAIAAETEAGAPATAFLTRFADDAPIG